MIRNPDMVLVNVDGNEVAKPDWHKVFVFGGKDSKVTHHECLYEGKVAYEKLYDHVIFAQITVSGERKEGDKYKDIENTPTDAAISNLIPRWQLLYEKKLWRYLTPFKFKDLITSRSLYFARLDQFEDNLEGISPFSCMKAIIRDGQKNDEQKKEAVRLYKKRMENNRKLSFACCWHLNTRLNEEMWNIYGQNSHESVCIKTDAQKLERSLRKSGFPVLNEPVQYFDEPYFNQNAYWFPTMFKRSEYKPEQEFRSILFAYGVEQKGLKLKINPEELITKIYVHPNASKEYFKEIKLFIKQNNLKIPVVQEQEK